MPPEQATIDITLRIRMEQARRDAAQVTSFLSKISKQAAQTGKQGAAGVDRLERAIQDLNYSTVAGFDAMSGANQQFGDGLNKTKENTEGLLKSYIDYKALAMDIAEGAGQIGAMGEEAARRRDLAESFDLLAEQAGLSGDEIVKAMTKAARGTVDANTIMATSNMVLGSKFKTSSEDMAKMMEFARLKSKQYGMTVTAAFQRMTYGAVKSEVEFLDELGITIKLNDAIKMYADSLGKSAKALTANERSQSIWNALLLQADDQLEAFPDGVTKSTDAYEQMRIKVLGATQAMGDFLDRSKIGPVMSIVAQAIQGVAVVMTPLILAKQMATQASTAHTAALVKETAALGAQAPAAAGAAAATGGKGILGRVAGKIPLSRAGLAAAAPAAAGLGVAAGAGIAVMKKRNEVLKDTAKEIEATGTVQDKFVASLQEQAKEEGDAVAVAKRYAAARRDVSAAIYKDGDAIDDLIHAAARNQFNTKEQINARREEVKQIIYLSSDAYPKYEQAMAALNAELPKGAEATRAMSEASFTLKKRLSEIGQETDDVREKTRLYAVELEKMAGGGGFLGKMAGMAGGLVDPMIEKQTQTMRALGDEADKIAKTALEGLGLGADELKAKMDALADSTGATSAEQRAATADVTALAQGYALGVIELERYKAGMEQAKTGALELTNAERQAVVVAKERRAEMAGAAIDQQEASRIASDAIKNYAADADVARRTQEALSVAMGETTFAQIENRKELTLLAQGLAMGTVSQERYMRAVRQAADGVIDMTDAEREAISVANQRAQVLDMQAEHMQELATITTNYENQATQAGEQYRASQEQSARAHAQRKEDIERTHRQRLQEIERDFEKSKFAAAIARDGVAMFAAEERRDEDLADAERTRAEGQAGEDRSFNETNRAAAASYQARLAEIDRLRQEETVKVQAAQAQEVVALHQQQADLAAQIAEAQAMQTQNKVEEAQKRTDAGRDAANVERMNAFAVTQERMQGEAALTQVIFEQDAARVASAQAAAATIMAAFAQVTRSITHGRATPALHPRGGRGEGMAGGGEGWVTGPRTFHVGRGEREFVHFSGDQRQMAPSQMNVGGRVNMDVTSQLDKIVGPLADRIGQSVLPMIENYLADEIRQGLQ